MLKFNRANSHDLYAVKQKKQKTVRQQTSSRGLESPKHISLESLEALVEQEHVAELGPPPRISLESLRKLIPRKTASTSSLPESKSIFHVSSLECPEASSLENLQLLVESSSQLIPALVESFPEQVQISTRNLLPTSKTSNVGKLRVWKIEAEEDDSDIQNGIPKRSESLEALAAAMPKEAERIRLPKSKPVETVAATVATERLKPEVMLDRLRELSEDNASLEKWIASLNLPMEMDIPEIRARIQEFLKNKSWEQHKAGKIRDVREGSLAQKLWTGFKEMSTAKQILVIIGLSILIAAVGFLTVQLLSLLWPSVLGFASTGEAALVEIGVEAFKQRQEPAFHLLLSHAEQAKPMSYAWANQYILWKYIR